MSDALRALLQQDAEQIAHLARKRRGERADRLAARALLMRVFSALAPADEAVGDETATIEAATNEAVGGETATNEAATNEAATTEVVGDETATNEAVADETATNEAVGDKAATTEAAAAASVELMALIEATSTLRQRLEGPGWRALAPIGQVWVRTPYPQFFMRPVCANQAQRLATQRDAQFSLKLALSEERIDWMEQRCTSEQPGLLRPIRVSESGQGARHGASELELLRKRGRSKFS